MIEKANLSRTALLMIMLSVLLAAAPHYDRLPVWTSVVVAACLFWRYMVFLERWRFPGKAERVFLVFLVFGGVFASFGTLLGPEVNTALLVNAIALKMLELHRKRDAFLVVMLNYFVVAMAFLFSRGMLQSLYIIFATIMVTSVLVSIQRAGQGRPFSDMRVALRLVMHSIPLMVILFILVPRIGPLWTVDLGRQAAKTGMSDFMSPGDIGELARNSDLAFRVEFENGMPPPNKLYWRGMTLNQFDGRRWTPGSVRVRSGWLIDHDRNLFDTDWFREVRRQTSSQNQGVYTYTITMEATNQPWLFNLRTAIPFKTSDKVFHRDYRLSKKGAVEKLYQYQVRSYTELPLDRKGKEWVLAMARQLPEGYNPRAIEQARQWRSEAASDREYMNRVLWTFNREQFRYTLRPPQLGKHTVDEFLFETRQGFCEHYASSFVVMMRAAGIPARVVTGYMGGEQSDVGNYFLVHQYDAHAWTEVWFPDTGWERVDPTEMVAPERIERGLEEALGEEGTFLEGSGLAMARFGYLDRLRLTMDYLDYAWAKWVLGYDSDRQMQLLTTLLGTVTPERILVVMVSASVAFLLIMSLVLYLQRPAQHHDAVTEAYLKLVRRLQRQGIEVRTGDTPALVKEKAALQAGMTEKGVPELVEMFIQLKYGPGGGTGDDEREFIRQARRTSRRLA